jgi:Transposase DDE domain
MDDRSLYEILYTFFDWHPSRIKTFSCLIFAVIRARTVRIKELANSMPSDSGIRAKISQIERFFLKQAINHICFGKIILKLSCSKDKIKIAIDRTNWKFGKKNLNFFVAAIVYENISLPIAWLLLDKKGNSSTEERKILLEKVLKIVPKEQIEIILADREFVGEEWLKYLSSREIPFAIRVKKNERIKHENGGMMALGKFFSNMQIDESKAIKTKIYNKKIKINMTCLQLEKEQLFIASNVAIGKEALLAYKQRVSILKIPILLISIN